MRDACISNAGHKQSRPTHARISNAGHKQSRPTHARISTAGHKQSRPTRISNAGHSDAGISKEAHRMRAKASGSR